MSAVCRLVDGRDLGYLEYSGSTMSITPVGLWALHPGADSSDGEGLAIEVHRFR